MKLNYLTSVIALIFFSSVMSQVQTLNLTPEMDATVNDNSPSSYDNSSLISVGRFANRVVPGFPTTYHTKRGTVYFEFGTIPSNAIVVSAELILYGNASPVGSPSFKLIKITSPWLETGINWSNSVAPNSIVDPTDGASFSISGINQIADVKNQVQKIISGVYENNGWMILLSSGETSSANKYQYFGSSENTNSSLKPKLTIKYYIPLSISDALITHQNLDGTADGSISPTLINGPGGTYSYQWFDRDGEMSGETSLNLEDVPCGWYGLKVTSNVSGSLPFYYSFLVGQNCNTCPINYNPGPNFIDDAQITYTNTSTLNSLTNYGGNLYIGAGEVLIWGTTARSECLINTRLWIDPSMIINSSDLYLSGISHNQVSRPNDAELNLVTSDWNESIVTYSSKPSNDNSININMPPTSTSNENRTVNMKDYYEYWQQDNANNFGVLFKLDTYSNETTIQQFHSSDYTDSTKWPKVNFEVSVSNPETPHYCNQVFAKLERTLRGVKYKPYLSHLYFYYDEEYNTSNTGLKYSVYSELDPVNAILDGVSSPISNLEYGDNRYTLDISSLVTGNYILKVTNDKKEEFYLRFQINN